MPKILRIINRLNLGGPTYNAAYLTKHLAPEFETVLAAGMKQDSEESSAYIVERMDIPVEYLPSMHRAIHPGRDHETYQRIRKLIRDFRPDIVHTHAAKAGTLGRLAAMHSGVKVIVHTFHGHVFHSYFSPVKTRLFLGIERYLARRSSAIVAISRLQKEELCHRFHICPPEKCEVIPLGFDLARFSEDRERKGLEFRKSFGLKPDDTVVGIIGRLTAIKNHRMFLDAYRKALQETGPGLKAVIVGDGEDRVALETYCRESGLRFADQGNASPEADVVFTSWIRDVDRAIAGMDIVALTSRNEGTPVSLIEAQAGGKPVVSTLAGGTADVVQDGTSGLLCAVDDTETFSRHLARLAGSTEERQRMGAAGREFVMQRFHFTRLVEDMRGLYGRLLDGAS